MIILINNSFLKSLICVNLKENDDKKNLYVSRGL